MKIAIDAMGGDFAPQEIVKGGVMAVQEYKDISVVLVGDVEKIEKELERCHALGHPRISIQKATQVIEMDEQPAIALRKKKDASVAVATKLVKDKVCDAVIAPGSTGAAVAAALFGLKRIPGIDRPAIATPIPTNNGFTVLLDSGANANSKPINLVQSAIMGCEYAKIAFHKENPIVGLLSIGEESSKGNDLVKETYPLLENLQNIPFYGNVEGRDIPKGTVDVVTCDGFVGNVALKLAEGVATTVVSFIKDEVMRGGLRTKLGAWLLKPALLEVKKKMSADEYGGAPLLGVDGVFIIAHGSSKAKDICSAVRVSAELAEGQLVDTIKNCVANEGEI